MVGDYFVVWLGEKVVIDGWVVEGSLVIDVFFVIGELLLVEVVVGDEVIGVIVNIFGWFVVEVIVVGLDIELLCIVIFVEVV